MPPQLPPQYSPKDVESAINQRWQDANAYHAEPSSEAPPYSIVIPPPNVTAPLHLGHALNNTLQDVLTRWRRMAGDNAMWMPGTDHAGIATQTVVEKRVLLEEGKKRTDFERDEFIEKIQDWKDEYEGRITEQLKEMGCSCDWDRQRFTMDETCAKAVREAFFRLFKDGLIYRGKRLVNWDPATQTALADDEVETRDIDGNFYYMRYPLIGPPLANGENFVTVATTRPETMLGDTAVAINPKDPRAAELRGRMVLLPIVNREIPIIEDDYVVLPDPDGDDPKARYASGFLKVTPAHDPNDYEIGQRHDLAQINVMAPDGSISKDHGWPEEEWADDSTNEAGFLLGKDRFEARKLVVMFFKDHEMMGEIKPYRHAVGHSYRSHVPIEPYLSDQWYVKVTDDKLRGAALRALHPSQNSGESCSGTGVSPVIQSQTENFRVHRRHLPHWQSDGSTYFVTFRLGQGELSADERQMVLDACLHWHGDRAQVFLVTVMHDHLHLLIRPLKKKADGRDARPTSELEWHSLPDLMHSIKSFTAHAINKQRGTGGALWQEEYFDRLLRDESEFEEKWEYMWMNPVNAGLAERPEDYAFTAGGDSALRADDGRDARPTQDNEDTQGKEDWEGGLRFYPERYAKTYETWLDNLRDWCISRQLWWGHRIPVWHRQLSLSEQNSGQVFNDAGFYALGLDHLEYENWIDTALTAVGPNGIVDFSDSQWLPTGDPVDFDFYVCTVNDKMASDLEAEGFERDPDVLDTWFSSALWPMSTMGWPDVDGNDVLATWNPTNVLCTAREIITLWVVRMVQFNLYFHDRLPFKDVFIHAMIQDGFGQKMSKSLGNGVDPMDLIHSHGADAMRFTLASMTTHTQDVRMPVDIVDPETGETVHPEFITTKAGHKVAAAVQEHGGRKMVSSYGVASGEAKPTDDMPLARNTSEKFDLGQRFANKMWNAVRFSLENLSVAPDPEARNPEPGLADRWVLSRLARTIRDTDAALANYEFANYANGLYDFFWRDLCDWYLESIKPTVRENPAQQRVLASCIDASLRMLHPAMPFITERLWEALNQTYPQRGVEGLALPANDLLIKAPWPEVDDALIDEAAEKDFELIQQVVGAIREVRTTYKVPPRQQLETTAKAPAGISRMLLDNREITCTLANTIPRGVGPGTERPDGAAVAIVGHIEVYIHDLVDTGEERVRLEKRAAELDKQIANLNGRLSNKKYVDKAPAKLVQETRDQLVAAEAEQKAVVTQLEAL